MDKVTIDSPLKTRVLVTGGSGWIARAAVQALITNFNYNVEEILIISQSPKPIAVGEHRFRCTTWDNIPKEENLDLDFLLPFAFVTREKLGEYSLEDYVNINSTLIAKHSEMIRKFKPLHVINISSGAAFDLSAKFNGDEGNFYGRLKLAEEESYRDACAMSSSKLVTARLWNCSGFGITKVGTFALADFVTSAIKGEDIIIHARSEVFRRYVDISEFLTVCIDAVKNQEYLYIESGGELVEIRKLAHLITNQMNSISKVYAADLVTSLEPNNYFSKSREYEKLLWSNFGRLSLTLEEQITQTAEYIRTHL